MTFAEQIPQRKRRTIQAWSVVANCLGALSEVMLDSSVLLISYIALLGGGESLNMLVAGATGFLALFLQIPSGMLAKRIGLKNTMYLSCTVGCLASLAMAGAGFAGGGSQYLVVALCFVYCVSRCLFSASWYPIVDAFVAPSERGHYFGILRFIYTIFTGGIFFAVGLALGEKPSVWALQLLIAVCALLQFARAAFVYFIDLPPNESNEVNVFDSLCRAAKNKRLAAFSVYLFFMAIVAFLILPLTYVYLKQTLGYGVNEVQSIATLGMVGSICGYLIFGTLLKKLGIKKVILLIHTAYIFIPLALFFCGSQTPNLLWIVGGIVFISGMTFASFFCMTSAEMYSCAPADNKVMSITFCQTLLLCGRMLGSWLSSLLIASGILMASWKMGSIEFSSIQTIFALACGLSILFLPMLMLVPAISPSSDCDYYTPPQK